MAVFSLKKSFLTKLVPFLLAILVSFSMLILSNEEYKGEKESKASSWETMLEEDGLGASRRNSFRVHPERNALYPYQFQQCFSFSKKIVHLGIDLKILYSKQKSSLNIVRAPPVPAGYAFITI